MNNYSFEQSLACPKCKNLLHISKEKGFCKKCNRAYSKTKGFWNLTYNPSKTTKSSLKEYENLYSNSSGGPKDGSYQILAAIAKGNKTIDIACGDGSIEAMCPSVVGVDFSINALRKARAKGAKYLLLADAHYLPFSSDHFDIAISSGNLEHFDNPKKAITEMVRISKIQILIVHSYPPFPFSKQIFSLSTRIFNIKHQYIERPLSLKYLENILKEQKVRVVYKGTWTLPLNYGRVIKILPEFKNIPSCLFIISIKNG